MAKGAKIWHEVYFLDISIIYHVKQYRNLIFLLLLLVFSIPNGLVKKSAVLKHPKSETDRYQAA